MSKRVSLILKDTDEAAIGPYLDPTSAESDAVRSWAQERGITVSSEASILRVLLHAGSEAIRESALDIAYTDLADEFNSPSADDERRTARARYVERTDVHR